jgi:hypothetical protein
LSVCVCVCVIVCEDHEDVWHKEGEKKEEDR